MSGTELADVEMTRVRIKKEIFETRKELNPSGATEFLIKKRARRGGPDCEVGCKGPSFLFPRYMYLRATTDEEDCANTYCLSPLSPGGGRRGASDASARDPIYYTQRPHNTTKNLTDKEKRSGTFSPNSFLHAKFFLVAVSVRAALSLYFREKGEKKTHYRTQLSSQCVQSPNPPPMTRPLPPKKPYST